MKWTKLVLLTLLLGLLQIADLSAQARLAAPNSPDAVARSGQSEIIINTDSSDRDIAVWVNDALVAHVAPKKSEKIIVYNGQNKVEAADTTLNRQGQWNIGAKKQIIVNSDSNRITINMTTRYGSLLNPSIRSTLALGGGTVPPAPAAVPMPLPSAPAAAAPRPGSSISTGSGIEGALERAAEQTLRNVPARAIIAIVYITAPDQSATDFIAGELEFIWVNGGFIITDRSQLDRLRREQNFQTSGEVDDATAVSIGKFAGADIIVTGRVDGEGSLRRLRLRAIDTQTAQVVGVSSERI